jgi:hypothetical protein
MTFVPETTTKAPPCASCRFFRPAAIAMSPASMEAGKSGVILCQAFEMKRDFTCFETRGEGRE